MPTKNVISYTAMLTAYAENSDIHKARNLFDRTPKRTIASWNAMITAYMRNPDYEKAIELFLQLPLKNSVSYAAMITGFVRSGMFNKAEELYSKIPVKWQDSVCSNALISGYLKIGELDKAILIFEGMQEKDIVSWSSILAGYCRNRRIDEARELFDNMPIRNVVSWTTMINGYMKMGRIEEGFNLLLQVKREGMVEINSVTLTVIFEACGSHGRYIEGIQVHGLVLFMGLERDVFLGNAIITMYGRLGLIDAATLMFHQMIERDLVSWNSLIDGYFHNGMIEQASIIFNQMPGKDTVSWTTMISGFFNNSMPDKAMQIFEMMPRRDDIAWTAVISGFVHNQEFEKAFCWFTKMLQNVIRPNALTFTSILSASASLAALNQGLQIHAHVVKMNMEFDLSIQNSLVSMYSKCGTVTDAHRVFNKIDSPNVVSFNSIITGFAQSGCGKEVLELFNKMKDEGLEPNEITFLSVLSACTHVGFVEEGWAHFNTMESSYGIEPGVDHYACMVDLLGRAGLLDDAMVLICSMPMEPHFGVWGALLGASRTHLRLDLAKLAAYKIFELDPRDATPYVVLSKLYSLAGRKKDGEVIRRSKISKGLKKNPGCSWVTVKDKVRVFLAGDRTHVEFQDIKTTLWIIMKEIRSYSDYSSDLANST